MRCKKIIQMTSCLLTAALLFTSCGQLNENNSPAAPVKPQSMLSSPQLDYEVPEYEPGVLVSRSGYPDEADKAALVKGKKLPDQFRLINTDTNETVYTGDIEKRGTIDGTWEYGLADFSEFTQTGSYYIECDIIGQSYPFEIGEKLYEKIFEEVLKTVKEEVEGITSGPEELSDKEFQDCMVQMILLLLSYELYPQVYGSGEAGQIPQILEITAQLVRQMSLRQDIRSGSTGGGEYVYAAAFAKFSYLYQSIDSRYATEVLNLADKAWRFAQKQEEGETSSTTGRFDAKFGLLAATELYRATGQYKYRSVILDYGITHYDENKAEESVSDSDSVGRNTEAEPDESGRGDSLAKVTYLSTRQKVDVELCGKFMKEIMLEAERIAGRASGFDSAFHEIQTEEELDSLAWDMVILSVVEYVITNHEYGQIIENQHHYFNGRNPGAFCYWNTGEDGEEGMLLNDHPIWTAAYLLMLSEMLTNG